jgi:hypothetical protein
VVGGSDDHTPENTSDIRAGSPTTVVFASSLSEPAIVEGLRAGRTYVRVRDPNGPSIEFTALTENGPFELGDTIYEPCSTIAFEAVVTGARGQTLQWMRRGIPVKTVRIDEDGPFLTSAIYTE